MRDRYFTHVRMGNINNKWVFTGVGPKAPYIWYMVYGIWYMGEEPESSLG